MKTRNDIVTAFQVHVQISCRFWHCQYDHQEKMSSTLRLEGCKGGIIGLGYWAVFVEDPVNHGGTELIQTPAAVPASEVQPVVPPYLSPKITENNDQGISDEEVHQESLNLCINQRLHRQQTLGMQARVHL